MASREEFMRQMGLTMDDVVDPAKVKTKYPMRDTAAPNTAASAAAAAPAPAKRGFMAYSDEYREPQVAPAAPVQRSAAPAAAPAAPRASAAAAAAAPAAAAPSGLGQSSARAAFLRSLGIDNMELPPECSADAAPAQYRASQEEPKSRVAAAAAAAAMSSNDEDMTARGGFAPPVRPDVTLGHRKASYAGMNDSASVAAPPPKPAAAAAAAAASSSSSSGHALLDRETEGMTVEEIKQAGNKHFEEGDFRKSVRFYTKAIERDPGNCALYSNRSAAYLLASKQMGIDTRVMALRDADKVVELRPDWFKGYSRRGDALFKLERFAEAVVAYERGLALDAGNANLMHSLGEARNAAGGFAKRHSSWSTAPQQLDTLASASGGAGSNNSASRNARAMMEEMKTEMQRQSRDCVLVGNDYREAELQRYRSLRSFDSSTNATSSSFAAAAANARRGGDESEARGAGNKAAPPARGGAPVHLDKGQIPEEFSSAAAAAYQQNLIEQYRKKKAGQMRAM